MQGSDKRFVIPVYQRNYDWRTENCKQLYDDLIKVIKRERKSHFFGSIVSVHNDGEFNEYLVIDGQQRLTTISLLLLAMYNLMEKQILVPAKGNLADKIYKTYLIDEWQEDNTRIKLKPVKNDRNAFEKLFNEESEHVPDSNLTINYNYFYSRIQKEEITIDELYEAVTKLEIINITLNQDDNPQLIFESLNSTGVALSEGDKIRNFILMGLPTKEQSEFYEKYWNKIEICTGYDVSMFVRDYLSVKQQLIPAISQVYFTFKAFVEESAVAVEPLLEELLGYAKRYETLLKGNTPDNELNRCIYRLNRLETTVTRPFFLEVLRLNETSKLSLSDVKEVFLYTESYLFRRTICFIPTNSLNKIFLMLHREIIRYDGTDSNYLEKFKYALQSKSDRGRFPDNAEFVDAFAARPVYQMNSKNKIYMLERFENYGTVEAQNVYKQCDDGVYTVEHIMPQHLTPAWIKELGEDYEEIHETWLHRIANLTLTGYNSKYSNSPFAEKRDMKNGFIDSHLYMNKWIGQQKHWGLTELQMHSQILMYRALAIWSFPATDYVPAGKQVDSYSLYDDVDLSGREISRFGYKNTEQPVGSWIEMMEQVLKILHAEDKSVLSRLAYSKGDSNELEAYVSNNPQDLRDALEIEAGIFIEKNTSTATKMAILHKFFKAYGANEEDLVFYLKDANDAVALQKTGKRHDLRYRYWTFALPHLQQVLDDETGHGCFCGRSPTKNNWLSGFFGIHGFNISCIANYDSARVQLVLAHSSKERNKEAFDYLYSHKAEIEKTLGNPINWLRSDDALRSCIEIRLEDVSIENEADWTRMAKFHVEWSKQFYDAFVPLLKGKYYELPLF